jgi:hypothetical protein
MAVKRSAVHWEGQREKFSRIFCGRETKTKFWSCDKFEEQRESTMEMNWEYKEGEIKYRTQEKEICIFVTVQSLTKQISNTKEKDAINLASVEVFFSEDVILKALSFSLS